MTFTIVMTENKELIRCSKCKNSKLTECFSVNPKGKLYKICNRCKNPSSNNVADPRLKDSQGHFEKSGPVLNTYTIVLTRHEGNVCCKRSGISGDTNSIEFFHWLAASADVLEGLSIAAKKDVMNVFTKHLAEQQ
jgi:hypothetical protein